MLEGRLFKQAQAGGTAMELTGQTSSKYASRCFGVCSVRWKMPLWANVSTGDYAAIFTVPRFTGCFL